MLSLQIISALFKLAAVILTIWVIHKITSDPEDENDFY